MTVAPARSYDRSDWASAFVNVEQELTDVALTPVRGTVPPNFRAPSIAMAPDVLSGMGIACITPSMATA